jgi:transcription initiation factor TFIIB
MIKNPYHKPKMNMDIDDKLWNLFDSFQQPSNEGGDGDDNENKLKNDVDVKTNVKEGNKFDNNIFEMNDKCSFCNSDQLVLDDGNYVCLGCGTLFERYIDSSAEWRYYGHEDSKSSDPTRCGLPSNELLPNSSLGTIIGNKIGECYEMRIIRKYQMWGSMTYKERTLYNIFDSMTINAVNNGIPATIIDDAKGLYKKISELKLSRGENRSGIIASSIYMSCKTHNVPRSAKEIAKIFNLTTTTMTKGCKKFQEILRMELASTNASDFIHRFCSKLNMSKEMKETCMYVVNKADEMSIASECIPVSLASGAIYLVSILCKIPIDKKNLASICGTSVVTISKCYKRLNHYRMYLLPEEIIKAYGIK